MRRYLTFVATALLVPGAILTTLAAEPEAAAVARPLPAVAARQLPRWRGFNLLEMFYRGGNPKQFEQNDFRMISELGFNFVRLPMDYRLWIQGDNWLEFDEEALRRIDQAVELGGKYGIHVCLNFHRAPGYTVARPPEKLSLWTDAEAQRVCALHWARFARRYKGLPNERLSFNLMNEPSDIPPAVYAKVVRQLVAAIRGEDPQRLVVADGLKWGRDPVLELADLGIAQATRGYTPSAITHYKASWVRSENFPFPRWPRPLAPSGVLLSPSKKEGSYPLVIDGPFSQAMQLRLHVMTVSQSALLVVRADERAVLEKTFKCSAGTGEWKKAEFKSQYNLYQNLYDRDYTADIPAGTRQIRIAVTAGDWLEVGEIGLKAAGGREASLTLGRQWGQKPEPLHYVAGATPLEFVGLPLEDRQWLWNECVEPWKAAQARGIGVMVGEWGCHNQTPHDVVLRWAEDCLANWKRAGWGWALWNFRGSFGILDSGRADVDYEDFHGHKLDRKFLRLLQQY